jgi:hypothetical protein
VRSNLLWAAIVAAVMLPFAQTKPGGSVACTGPGCSRPAALVSSTTVALERAPSQALPAARAKD